MPPRSLTGPGIVSALSPTAPLSEPVDDPELALGAAVVAFTLSVLADG